MAASLLALTLGANDAYSKEVTWAAETEYTNRNYRFWEATEDTPPGSDCPVSPGHCIIEVILYDDGTGEIGFAEMVIPFDEPLPTQSQQRANDILSEVSSIILGNGIVYQDYQP